MFVCLYVCLYICLSACLSVSRVKAVKQVCWSSWLIVSWSSVQSVAMYSLILAFCRAQFTRSVRRVWRPTRHSSSQLVVPGAVVQAAPGPPCLVLFVGRRSSYHRPESTTCQSTPLSLVCWKYARNSPALSRKLTLSQLLLLTTNHHHHHHHHHGGLSIILTTRIIHHPIILPFKTQKTFLLLKSYPP